MFGLMRISRQPLASKNFDRPKTTRRIWNLLNNWAAF
jgi:hypothetical protein